MAFQWRVATTKSYVTASEFFKILTVVQDSFSRQVNCSDIKDPLMNKSPHDCRCSFQSRPVAYDDHLGPE